MREPGPILVTGATGYVGSKLVDELQSRGHAVRTLSRRGAGGGDARKGDVLSGDGLPEALEGAKTAYYLVHSMGARRRLRGQGPPGGGQLRRGRGERGRRARHLPRRARAPRTPSTCAAATRSPQLLRARLGPTRVVYVRAAMIVGPGSASYDILEHLVKRLPVMIVPRWLDTKTQPIALSDVLKALADVGRARRRASRSSSSAAPRS